MSNINCRPLGQGPSKPKPKELSYLSDDLSSSPSDLNSTDTASITSTSSELRRLPMVISGCVKSGMSACEIGQYLHKVVEGGDTPVNSVITDMINAGKPYHEIGRDMLKMLDLRSEDGNPLSDYVVPGNKTLKHVPVPMPEPIRSQLLPLLRMDDSELEERYGSDCAIGDLDEDSSDDEFKTYVARIVKLSRHIAKVVEVSSFARSIHSEMDGDPN